jgi:hypothetical protein
MPILLTLLCVVPMALAAYSFSYFYLLTSIEFSAAVAGIVMLSIPFFIEEFKVSSRNKRFIETFEVVQREHWAIDWLYSLTLPIGFYVAIVGGSALGGFVVGRAAGEHIILFSHQQLIFASSSISYPISFALILLFTVFIIVHRPTWSFRDLLFAYVITAVYLSVIEGTQNESLVRLLNSYNAMHLLPAEAETLKRSHITIALSAALTVFTFLPSLLMGSLLAASKRKRDIFYGIFESLDKDAQEQVIDLMKDEL